MRQEHLVAYLEAATGYIINVILTGTLANLPLHQAERRNKICSGCTCMLIRKQEHLMPYLADRKKEEAITPRVILLETSEDLLGMRLLI